MKKNRFYIGLVIMGLILVFTNPSPTEFKQYLSLNTWSSKQGRQAYFLFFSTYVNEKSYSKDWSKDTIHVVPALLKLVVDTSKVEDVLSMASRDGLNISKSTGDYVDNLDALISELKKSKYPYYSTQRKENFYKERHPELKKTIKVYWTTKYYEKSKFVGIMKNFLKISETIDSMECRNTANN